MIRTSKLSRMCIIFLYTCIYRTRILYWQNPKWWTKGRIGRFDSLSQTLYKKKLPHYKNALLISPQTYYPTAKCSRSLIHSVFTFACFQRVCGHLTKSVENGYIAKNHVRDVEIIHARKRNHHSFERRTQTHTIYRSSSIKSLCHFRWQTLRILRMWCIWNKWHFRLSESL